jgi:hypothetical protein
LTINIKNHYINTDRYLNVRINKYPHHVNGVWTDPLLEEIVELCKNIKTSNNERKEIIEN